VVWELFKRRIESESDRREDSTRVCACGCLCVSVWVGWTLDSKKEEEERGGVLLEVGHRVCVCVWQSEHSSHHCFIMQTLKIGDERRAAAASVERFHLGRLCLRKKGQEIVVWCVCFASFVFFCLLGAARLGLLLCVCTESVDLDRKLVGGSVTPPIADTQHPIIEKSQPPSLHLIPLTPPPPPPPFLLPPCPPLPMLLQHGLQLLGCDDALGHAGGVDHR
jgi:hypothetical protein